MVSTRSSQKSTNGSDISLSPSIGSKRKAEAPSSQEAKRRERAGKVQKTIEETIVPPNENGGAQDTEMSDSKPQLEEGREAEEGEKRNDPVDDAAVPREDPTDSNKKETEAANETSINDDRQADHDQADDEPTARKGGSDSQIATKGVPASSESAHAAPWHSEEPKSTAIEQSDSREASTPHSILEKGLIYFFFRGRINIDNPSNVQDVARSYIILRPFPHGAALGSGPIPTSRINDNNRVLALPKKVLPKGPGDRFMVFVEQAKVSTEDIKSKVLESSDYATQTQGSRHAPAATPIGEGVYAITSTGRESHLAYILTLPRELGEVQRDIGLGEKGSFVMSAKNPNQAGPANASLPQGPEYPSEILDHFRTLRWASVRPEMLDYPNAQFLLIGGHDADLSKATEPQKEDVEGGRDEPLAELEKLEHEDEVRAEGLNGDHAVFADLGLSSKEFSEMQTTW